MPNPSVSITLTSTSLECRGTRQPAQISQAGSSTPQPEPTVLLIRPRADNLGLNTRRGITPRSPKPRLTPKSPRHRPTRRTTRTRPTLAPASSDGQNVQTVRHGALWRSHASVANSLSRALYPSPRPQRRGSVKRPAAAGDPHTRMRVWVGVAAQCGCFLSIGLQQFDMAPPARHGFVHLWFAHVASTAGVVQVHGRCRACSYCSS